MDIALKQDIDPEEIRSQLPKGQGGIGFLFHATDWETLSFSIRSPHSRSPEYEEALWNIGPRICAPIYEGSQLIGAHIVMLVPFDLWMGKPSAIKRFRETQFLPALELAKQAGLSMVAMGASTPYVCNYGLLLRGTTIPAITTGHAATAAMLKAWVSHCCNEFSLTLDRSKIALFGAAGRLGVATARYLCHEEAPRELVLVDLPDKLMQLRELALDLFASDLSQHLKVSVHTFSPDTLLPDFDGAILTSSASTPYLTAGDLKRAKFWIDDSHPRAATLEAERAAKNDTLYIECFARGPTDLDVGYSFRLPSKQDCYTCFAEGYVAWREGMTDDFVVGMPAVWTIAHVNRLLKKYDFAVGPYVGKDGSSIVTGPITSSYKPQAEHRPA